MAWESKFQACEDEKNSLEELLREQRSIAESAKAAEAEREKDAEDTLRLQQVGRTLIMAILNSILAK